MGHQNQWVMLFNNSHVRTGISVSKILSLATSLTTHTVSMEGSEGPLKLTQGIAPVLETGPKRQYMIPVNHREAGPLFNIYKGKLSGPLKRARTINTSRYLWDRGSVVFERKRDLEVGGQLSTRPYSTKTLSETPSWKDNKAVKRLESL